MSVHRVEALSLSPETLGDLLCLDHADKPLHSVPYESLASGKSLDHKKKLKDSILAKGVLTPIVAQRRPGGGLRLVDGHHRAVAAWGAKFSCPAIVHSCSCNANQLDYFQLCPLTLVDVEAYRGSI